MKKYHLKPLGKIILGLIFIIIFIYLIHLGIKRIDRIAQECDEARGYTCSYYDIRQYSIKGE